LKYRSDIDGLRCLAVLPVLFFHAGFSLFPGGYTGVDIFFVISGFLITQILLDEVKENRFSIINFYRRRARRLLPALFSVLFFATVVGTLIIPPELFREYGQSLVSVGLFISNIFFFQETGYFGFAAEKMPLLHTWSLAVEEQFYVVTPLLIYAIYRFGERVLAVVFCLAVVLSLTFSEYQIQTNQQSSSFFLILSRAWELLAGSLIAIYRIDKLQVSSKLSELVSLLGLSCIVFSMVFFDKNTLFPGVNAFIPVAGAFLIIGFCRPNTLVFQLLSMKLLVWFGLISYSLYLVHQPVFALTRFLFISEPSGGLYIFLILLSTYLAYLNYRYVEKPMRQMHRFYGNKILLLAITGCTITIAVGLAIHKYNGFPERYPEQPLINTVQASPLRKKCHNEGGSLPISQACRLNGEQANNWVVLGDSHGVELAYMLAARLKPLGIGLTQYTLSSCPPALLHKLKMPACSNWQNEVVTRMISDDSISTVVLAFRASAFIAGKDITHYPTPPDEDRSFEFEFGADNVDKQQSYQYYWENYQHLITTLLSSGKRVIYVDPIPELPLDIRQLIYPKELITKSSHLSLTQTTSTDFYHLRNQFMLEKLASLPPNNAFARISPLPIFCTNAYCSAVKNNHSLYFDDDHPSLYAAGELAAAIIDLSLTTSK
jgi:peptidoglycan/LPS O-acetylase OafA/YrhL